MDPSGHLGAVASKAVSLWRLARPKTSAIVARENADNNAFWSSLEPILNNVATLRKIDLQSPSKQTFTAFLFEPRNFDGDAPCAVVYCPSESAASDSGQEALEFVKSVLPLKIAVLCLGMTGAHSALLEQGTVTRAVHFLRYNTNGNRYHRVALWGRSSGAVAVLRCAERDPTLAAIICDSAYSDLLGVLELPEWIETPLMSLRHFVVGDTASSGGFTGTQTQDTPLDIASRCFVPALFIHGADDDIVPKKHAEALRNAYAGEKQILIASGTTHDSKRPLSVIARALLFIVRAFRKDGSVQLTAELAHLASAARVSESDTPRTPPPASDSQIRKLLSSNDAAIRRRGLLLAALAACPSHRGAKFEPVLLPRLALDGSGQFSIQSAGMTVLPELSSELAVVCSIDNPISTGGGVVVFAVVSSQLISLSSVRLVAIDNNNLADKLHVTRRGFGECCGIWGGLRCEVEDLVAKPIALAPSSTPYAISFEVMSTKDNCVLAKWAVSDEQVQATVRDVAPRSSPSDAGTTVEVDNARQCQRGCSLWRATFGGPSAKNGLYPATLGGGPLPGTRVELQYSGQAQIACRDSDNTHSLASPSTGSNPVGVQPDQQGYKSPGDMRLGIQHSSKSPRPPVLQAPASPQPWNASPPLDPPSADTPIPATEESMLVSGHITHSPEPASNNQLQETPALESAPPDVPTPGAGETPPDSCPSSGALLIVEKAEADGNEVAADAPPCSDGGSTNGGPLSSTTGGTLLTVSSLVSRHDGSLTFTLSDTSPGGSTLAGKSPMSAKSSRTLTRGTKSRQASVETISWSQQMVEAQRTTSTNDQGACNGAMDACADLDEAAKRSTGIPTVYPTANLGIVPDMMFDFDGLGCSHQTWPGLSETNRIPSGVCSLPPPGALL